VTHFEFPPLLMHKRWQQYYSGQRLLDNLRQGIKLKKGAKLIFVLLTQFVLSCCNKSERPLLATDIRGPWYLNKWTSYHTLTFNDSTVFVDNGTDTVFTLKYFIDDNLLLTTNQFGQQTTDTITWLTSDSLVLSGIRDIQERRSYTRTKKKWNE
jgi:hypothetical protein